VVVGAVVGAVDGGGPGAVVVVGPAVVVAEVVVEVVGTSSTEPSKAGRSMRAEVTKAGNFMGKLTD